MAGTGGHVLIPTAVVKLALGLTLLLAAIWQWTRLPVTSYVALWVATTLYLALDAAFLIHVDHLTLLDVIIGYNSYYGFFLMAPLGLLLLGELDEQRLYPFLNLAFWICFPVGLAQYLTQKPLLFTESVDGAFAVPSWQGVDGSVRAFTFFTSGMGYGTFCCLVAAIASARLLSGSLQKRQLVMFLAAVFACYTTLTRNSYTQLAFAVATVFCLTRRSALQRLAKYLPFAFLLCSMGIAFFGVDAPSSDSAISSNLSTLIRVAEWHYYLTTYIAASHLQQLFGLGLVQNGSVSNELLFPIDSEFLAVLVHVGLVGFLLIFWVQWKTWTFLYRRACEMRTPLSVAVAGFWSTFLAVYFFSTALAGFSAVFIVALLAGSATTVTEDRLILGERELSPQPV
jgi:hypothetical protein